MQLVQQLMKWVKAAKWLKSFTVVSRRYKFSECLNAKRFTLKLRSDHLLLYMSVGSDQLCPTFLNEMISGGFN